MRRLLVAAALAALAGCAPGSVGWAQPGVSADQARADLRACRRWADDQIDPGHTADAATLTAAERSSMRREQQALTASCMAAKGYDRRPGR